MNLIINDINHLRPKHMMERDSDYSEINATMSKIAFGMLRNCLTNLALDGNATCDLAAKDVEFIRKRFSHKQLKSRKTFFDVYTRRGFDDQRMIGNVPIKTIPNSESQYCTMRNTPLSVTEFNPVTINVRNEH